MGQPWGNLAACKQQLRDLDALALYSLLMLSAFTRYTNPAKHTLSSLHMATYFIPFWSEHILDLGKISAHEAHTWAWGLVCGTWPRYIQPCPTIDLPQLSEIR